MALQAKTKLKYEQVIDNWFANNFKAAQAYKVVYGDDKSDATAQVAFNKIQSHPEMQKYIEGKHEEAKRYIAMDHMGVLDELKRWLEGDITEFMGLDSEQIKALPIQVRRLITKYKETRFETVDKDDNVTSVRTTYEVTIVSKERAIEMINKHLGFYEKDNQQKQPEIDLDKLSDDALMELYNAKSE